MFCRNHSDESAAAEPACTACGETIRARACGASRFTAVLVAALAVFAALFVVGCAGQGGESQQVTVPAAESDEQDGGEGAAGEADGETSEGATEDEGSDTGDSSADVDAQGLSVGGTAEGDASGEDAAKEADDQASAENQAKVDTALAEGKQVFSGTVEVHTDSELWDMRGRPEGIIPLDSTKTALVFDEPSTVNGTRSDAGREIEESATAPFIRIDDSFNNQYSGQHVTMAFGSVRFPNDVSPGPFSDDCEVLFAGDTAGIDLSGKGGADASSASDDAASGDYVLADSDTRRYTREELEAMDVHTLFLVRNEIFARHGCGFNNQELRDHFGSKPWYTETIPAGTYGTEILTDVERENALEMRAIEVERDSPYLN